jgi:hypothetical protein
LDGLFNKLHTTNKSDVGDYSYNAVNGVNSTHPHTPNSIAGLKTHTNNQDRTYTGYEIKKEMFKYHFQQNISAFLWQPVLLVNKNGEKHQASVSHSS